MGELWEDIRGTFSELRGAGKEFVFAWVGAEFVVPFIKDLTASWDKERVLHAVRTSQHIYPHYPREIREEWRHKAQPYSKYKDRISRDVFFKWFQEARPDLAEAIMREKHGWAWICEEIDIITADLFGAGG